MQLVPRRSSQGCETDNKTVLLTQYEFDIPSVRDGGEYKGTIYENIVMNRDEVVILLICQLMGTDFSQSRSL